MPITNELKEKLIYPKAIDLNNTEIYLFGKYDTVEDAVDALLAGHRVLLTHAYSDGLRILHHLKAQLGHRVASFTDKRSKRAKYQAASQLLLAEVAKGSIQLKKAPTIPFLSTFYDTQEAFALSFPHLQGLNSAWQWYHKGISIPSLQGKLHPYYGVYFPTRFEHIKLFVIYLENMSHLPTSAIEVGVGSGILSLLLLQTGVQHLQCTDTNPNALYSTALSLQKRGKAAQVELLHGDLLSPCHGPTDMILFNPPWLEAKHHIHSLDHAIYYPPGLFERFFEQADGLLSAKGEIVLLFSQLGQSSGHQNTHPISTLLKNSDVWDFGTLITQECTTRPKGHWRQRHNKERIEIWIIKRKK